MVDFFQTKLFTRWEMSIGMMASAVGAWGHFWLGLAMIIGGNVTSIIMLRERG